MDKLVDRGRMNKPAANCATALSIATFLFVGVACNQHSSDEPEVGDGKVEFERDIKPLLASTCVICHHSETMLGGLNLESRKTAFGGSDGRPFIVPGEPDSSLLYLVTENPHGKVPAQEKMPAMKDIFLSDEERGLLRRWIEQGAEWPSGEEGWIEPLKIDLKQS
jgi:mono/diheme cytochrome c family protein